MTPDPNNMIPSSVLKEYRDGIIPITETSASYASYTMLLGKDKFTDPTLADRYNIFLYPKSALLTDEKQELKTHRLLCLLKGVAKVTINDRFVSYIYPSETSGKLIGTVNLDHSHKYPSATIELITDSIVAVMEIDDELRERLLSDMGFLRNMLYDDLRYTNWKNNAVAV